MYRIRFTADGLEVLTDSIDEVKAVLLAGNSGDPVQKPAQKRKVGTVPSVGYVRNYRRVCDFLTAVRDNAPMVRSSVLVNKFKLAGARGLGGLGVLIHATCEEAGLSPHEVWTVVRNGKDHYWLAGPKIGDAISAISDLAAEHSQ